MERSRNPAEFDGLSGQPVTSVIPTTDTGSNCTDPPNGPPLISARKEAALHGSGERSLDHSDTRAAIVFVDMSGFTALTEVHGDHVAAEFAEDFAAKATAALGPNDQLIKTIGDAVMVSCYDADAAQTFLCRLGTAVRSAGNFPMLRAGVSTGPVVKRRGDVFGATVNIAARLTALAAPGQIITTRDVASAAAEANLAIQALGFVSIRNMSQPTEIFAVDTAGKHEKHVDPVCRMHVTAAATVATRTRRGQLYRLCSTACAQEFAALANSIADQSGVR